MYGVAVSPCNRFIVSGGKDRNVRIHRVPERFIQRNRTENRVVADGLPVTALGLLGERAHGFDRSPRNRLVTDGIGAFEGVWCNEEEQTTYYAIVIDGELRIPYCFGGSKTVTAHYYDCQVVGDKLFARFRWFEKDISGFALLQAKSRDSIVGSWWYEQHVRDETVRNDIRKLNPGIPHMNPIRMRRISAVAEVPEWATDYLDSFRTGGSR